MAKETIRQQHVRCGKKGCKGCPHGPYWYAFWKEDGRTRSRYVGKVAPKTEGKPHPWEAIFRDRTATLALAAEILGVSTSASKAEANRAYRERCLKVHPDRGGTQREQSQVNAAWHHYQILRGWMSRPGS